jgi:hypothetical protein
LKANKVNLFVSSDLFVFWYHSPNFLDTPHMLDFAHKTGMSHIETIGPVSLLCLWSRVLYVMTKPTI